MKVHFYSISKSGNVSYITDLVKENNKLTFNDLSQEGTENIIDIENPFNIHYYRTGKVNSYINFVLDKVTGASYENDLGLAFQFAVHTKKIECNNKKISIEYDFFIDGEFQDTVKIYLLIK